MSLTSLVRQEDSALSVWLAKRLPNVAAVRAAYRAAMPLRHVRRPVAPDRALVRWNTLGTAIDHRLRCAFVLSSRPGPVAAGVELAAGLLAPHTGERARMVGRQLLDEHVGLVDAHQPHRRGRPWLLPDAAEERLDRACYAMAWFEEVFRDGQLRPGTPIANANGSSNLQDLLTEVPGYVVRDLRLQTGMAKAHTALGALRDSTPPENCHVGPGFAGSGDVGGADADLVVGGLLLEVKATSKPEKLGREAIYQLAGYVLLDYTDAYRLDSVGLYLSRTGWLITWNLGEFFTLLGARRPVADLRQECAALCRSGAPQVWAASDPSSRESVRPFPYRRGDDGPTAPEQRS